MTDQKTNTGKLVALHEKFDVQSGTFSRKTDAAEVADILHHVLKNRNLGITARIDGKRGAYSLVFQRIGDMWWPKHRDALSLASELARIANKAALELG